MVPVTNWGSLINTLVYRGMLDGASPHDNNSQTKYHVIERLLGRLFNLIASVSAMAEWRGKA